jgi:hypothetical protein
MRNRFYLPRTPYLEFNLAHATSNQNPNCILLRFHGTNIQGSNYSIPKKGSDELIEAPLETILRIAKVHPGLNIRLTSKVSTQKYLGLDHFRPELHPGYEVRTLTTEELESLQKIILSQKRLRIQVFPPKTI